MTNKVIVHITSERVVQTTPESLWTFIWIAL